jgi:hypothetical protein
MNKYNIIILLIILIIYNILIIIAKYNNKIENIINNKKDKLIKYIKTKLNNYNQKLFLVISPELGDNIIFNGGTRYYCTIYNTVILVCKKSYYEQISYMYRDLNNILFYSLPDKYFNQYINYNIPYTDNDIKKLFKIHNIKYINFFNRNIKNRYNYIYDYIFTDNILRTYKTFNLNSNIAYTYFKLIRDNEREQKIYNELINIIGNKYVVIIDDEKRNFNINNKYIEEIELPIYKLSNNSKNNDKRLDNLRSKYIFDYILILEKAEKVISIDTALPWIVNFLNIKINMEIYPARIDNIIYKNKNIKKLKTYTSDIITSNLNINNYYLKYPCDVIKSIILL